MRLYTLLARRRVLGVGLAFLLEVMILAPLAYAEPSAVVGIPAAIAAAIGGTVAVVYGPWDGALVAFGGALVLGVVGGWGAGEVAALVVWPGIVASVGVFARRVAGRRVALRQLVTEQELERRRLALELHDETAQALAAALMTLRRLDDAASPQEAAERSAELRELLRGTIEDVRALAVDLRPKALDDLGLPTAAERLAASFAEQAGVTVDVDVNGPAERLPPDTEVALYRILQDALQQVALRTDARHVRVALTAAPGGAVLEVGDDGTAVDGGADGGADLAAARERLRLVGGQLAVHSRPGAGTVVRATVPAAGPR